MVAKVHRNIGINGVRKIQFWIFSNTMEDGEHLYERRIRSRRDREAMTRERGE